MENPRPTLDLSSLPSKPLLKPWYRLRFDGERALFQYGDCVVVFTGRAVGALLPRLLPLLDGTHDLAALSAEFPEAFEAVAKALAELQRRNLLTDGPALPAALAPSVVGAVHQAAADAGRDVSPARAFAKLERSAVALFGGSRVLEFVAGALASAGVGSVRVVDELVAAADADIAVIAPDCSDVECLRRANEAALRTGSIWMPILPFDGDKRIVGPLVVPAQTACYHCFLTRRRSAVVYGEKFTVLDGTPARFPAPEAIDLLAAGVAASVLTRWLVDRDGSLPGRYYSIEPHGTVALSAHRLYRVPRCTACGAQRRQGLPQLWARA
ncbi:MAG: TOMM precursor leader peptide-binding protein [Vulcanimicrobiaceae bacterium]